MSDTKHTPGPWKAQRGTGSNDHVYNIWGPDQKVGFMVCLNKATEDHEANAHLIAAAPNTLRRLEYTLSVLQSMPPAMVSELENILDESIDFDGIKQSIKQAKGE